MLADGKYVGAVDGLRNWDEYMHETEALLAARAGPPAIRRHRRDRRCAGLGDCHA